MAAVFLVNTAAICHLALLWSLLRCVRDGTGLADLVQPADGGAFGGVPEGFEFLVPGLAEG